MDLAIDLYTISDDNQWDEVTNELEKQGFEKHHDQSTYTYPMNKVGNVFLVDNFSKWINSWSQGKYWEDSDFILVYYWDWIILGLMFTSFKNLTYTPRK